MQSINLCVAFLIESGMITETSINFIVISRPSIFRNCNCFFSSSCLKEKKMWGKGVADGAGTRSFRSDGINLISFSS